MSLWKKNILAFVALFCARMVLGEIFLCELVDEKGGKSCGLYFGNTVICNPLVPCSRVVAIDMKNLLLYVERLLATDGAKVEPHKTFLLRLQKYIKEVLANPYRHYLIYKKYTPTQKIQFYHDKITEDAQKAKEPAKSTASAAGKNQKDIKDDPVALNLMKMGLLQPRSQMAKKIS